jgi:hypothetical protein
VLCCSVAVVGLPAPRKDHAVVMTRFARDCRDKTFEVTLALEKTLVPVDISHTMQHFSVHKKWNMRLLPKCLRFEAYKMGRTAKDPLDCVQPTNR